MSLPPSVNEVTGDDPTTAELSPCLSASFVRDLSRDRGAIHPEPTGYAEFAARPRV